MSGGECHWIILFLYGKQKVTAADSLRDHPGQPPQPAPPADYLPRRSLRILAAHLRASRNTSKTTFRTRGALKIGGDVRWRRVYWGGGARGTGQLDNISSGKGRGQWGGEVYDGWGSHWGGKVPLWKGWEQERG